MKGKPLVLMGICLSLSLFMGIFVHETYHVFEYSIHGIKINEVCIVGYKNTGSDGIGASGWVNGESSGVKEFKIPFAFNEIIPYILQIITTIWCYLGLLKFFGREK